MELWLGITLMAAFMQNARSLLQKRLTGLLSVNGATYVRFLYALPFAWLYAWWLWTGETVAFTPGYWGYVTVGAFAQIVATALLLQSFTTGNFALGTAFSKTEAAQAALFGLIILGDGVNQWMVAGIMVSLIGVIILSGNISMKQLFRPNQAMWLGLVAGAAFAVSVISFRGASLALGSGSYLQRAVLTVAVAVTIQSVCMGIYLCAYEPGQMTKVIRHWRPALWVGVTGMIASVGWFAAITLKNAAVVRAVGQIELLFTIITSVWLLKERLGAREILGMALVVVGIVLLI